MNGFERLTILNQIKQLSERKADIIPQMESRIQLIPTQDLKGDYQKNLTLIIRACELLLEDYKKELVR